MISKIREWVQAKVSRKSFAAAIILFLISGFIIWAVFVFVYVPIRQWRADMSQRFSDELNQIKQLEKELDGKDPYFSGLLTIKPWLRYVGESDSRVKTLITNKQFSDALEIARSTSDPAEKTGLYLAIAESLLAEGKKDNALALVEESLVSAKNLLNSDKICLNVGLVPEERDYDYNVTQEGKTERRFSGTYLASCGSRIAGIAGQYPSFLLQNIRTWQKDVMMRLAEQSLFLASLIGPYPRQVSGSVEGDNAYIFAWLGEYDRAREIVGRNPYTYESKALYQERIEEAIVQHGALCSRYERQDTGAEYKASIPFFCRS